MEEQRSSSTNNERGDAPPPKKEIYTHAADWTIYGMGWSQREEEGGAHLREERGVA